MLPFSAAEIKSNVLLKFCETSKGSQLNIDACYDWELIKALKTSPIRIISVFFAASTITAAVGK